MNPYFCHLCCTLVYFGDKQRCYSNIENEANYTMLYRIDAASSGSKENDMNSNDNQEDNFESPLHTNCKWQASSSSDHSIICQRSKELSERAFKIRSYFTTRSVPPQPSLNAPSGSINVNQTFDSMQVSGAEAGPSGIRQYPLGTDGKMLYLGHLNTKQNQQKSCSSASHFKSHTGEAPLALDSCEKQFREKVNSDTFARPPNSQKLFACKICGREFSGKSHLDDHIRTHTGEITFRCFLCKKIFSSKGALFYHVKTHKDKKRYKCDLCTKDYSRKNNLIMHLRTHTGERPYLCDFCGGRFASQDNRNMHIKSRHREKCFWCRHCGASFSNNENRNKHIREKHLTEVDSHMS